MANMKDIADRAGVSVATVSKVLNKQGNISQETRNSILAIAKELNYQPNLYARSLKKGNSHVIGIITEDLTVFNSSPIIDGIGARCELSGYHYILENLRINNLSIDPHTDRYNTLVNDSLNFMQSMQVDGIIFLGCHSHKLMSLPEINIKNIVFAYCSSADAMIPYVIYDDKQGAFHATSFLINSGHKNIGTITGLPDSVHTMNRLTGFQEALFEHGIPYNPRLTLYGDWQRDSGYVLAQTLIDRQVTAIFCHNDDMAMGVMNYCSKNGIEVGKDLSLIGFDDREICTVCRPALTTVALPLQEIGQEAASILIHKIENDDDTVRGEILLKCKFVERESTYSLLSE